MIWRYGGLAERLNAAVLKTVEPKGSGGSNPSPSASVVSQYRDVLKGEFARQAEKEFDDLAYKAGVDVNANRTIAAEVKALQTRAAVLGKRTGNIGCAIAVFFGGAVAALGIWAMLDRPEPAVTRGFMYAAAALAALGVLVIPLYRMASKRLNALKSQIAGKKEAAMELMKPLNDAYGWDIPCRLVEAAFPRVKFDAYLTAAGLDDLRRRGAWDDRFNDGISVKFALSGTVDGNAFVFCRYVEREWGEEEYTGTKDISWKEWEYYRDENGKQCRKRVTQHQKLVAKTKKPRPQFMERRFLVYVNDALPELSFDRESPALMQEERAVVERFKSVFGPGGRVGGEMEANFREIVDDAETGYGDDFAYLKRGRLNFFVSRHLSEAAIDTDPAQFVKWSFDEAREFFLEFNNRYFKDVYFALAPVLAIPHFAAAPVAWSAAAPDAGRGSEPSAWELEAIANSLGHPRFMPEDCKTPCILKAGRVAKDADGMIDVEVSAYGYSAQDRAEEVTCRGEDNLNHVVRIPWKEYHETEGKRSMRVFAGGEPSATFRRHMDEQQIKGPRRTVYAYVP